MLLFPFLLFDDTNCVPFFLLFGFLRGLQHPRRHRDGKCFRDYFSLGLTMKRGFENSRMEFQMCTFCNNEVINVLSTESTFLIFDVEVERHFDIHRRTQVLERQLLFNTSRTLFTVFIF